MKEKLKKIIAFCQKVWVSYLTRRKISAIHSHLIQSGIKPWIPPDDMIRNHKELWGKYIFNIKLKWMQVYGTLSEIYDFRYIPEDIYYTEIEPRLNNKAFSKAYTDKNGYHLFLGKEILPEILLRSVNGTYYDQDYLPLGEIPDFISWRKNKTCGKYVIKPTVDTGGGDGVRVITISHDKADIFPSLAGGISINDLFTFYKRDFLIQHYIEQHSFFSQFNKDSLNTIRILTYRSPKDESILILHRILRMGRAGSVVDNQASGGIACGIKPDGVLSEFGVDKYGNKINSSNEVVFGSVGPVPFLDKVLEIAIHVAGKFLYSRLLGMDFGVDKNEKIFLIEVNDSNNEINFYQMNNGPLFGEYTEEISRFCILEPKSFLIDFNLD